MQNVSWRSLGIFVCVYSLIERNFLLILSLTKDLLMPITVGLVLYGNFDEQTVRYFLSTAVILTCFNFMKVISRLPK